MTAHSMTAFARHLQTDSTGQFIWELRSVNHRYLEISLRLPDTLRSLEMMAREILQQRLSRGKIEGLLRFQPGQAAFQAWQLNRPLIERLMSLCNEVEQLVGPGKSLAPLTLLQWPNALIDSESDQNDLITRSALICLEKVTEQLIENRQREGDKLTQFILQRVEVMGEIVRQIRQHRPLLLERLRDRLLNRLNDIPLQGDSGRLEQELVFIAQRLDVDEELDRLDTHLIEIKAVLQRSEPVGRRLDFLSQELNREANTLSAKSNDSQTTKYAIELKVLIEQIREQVQNLE